MAFTVPVFVIGDTKHIIVIGSIGVLDGQDIH